MQVLDLFAGTFGAGYGYQRAGLGQVTGIDLRKRQRLPNGVLFVRGDARDVLMDTAYLRTFDFIHASPPCQPHTRARGLLGGRKAKAIEDLIPETREGLDKAGVPYVIENVPEAPLRPDLMLCGSMFPELMVYDATGRRWLRRHRIFELGGWEFREQPQCRHESAGARSLGVYGNLGDVMPRGGEVCRDLEEGRELMGMPWGDWEGLVQAIPPAYTEFIGRAFLRTIPPGQ